MSEVGSSLALLELRSAADAYQASPGPGPALDRLVKAIGAHQASLRPLAQRLLPTLDEWVAAAVESNPGNEGEIRSRAVALRAAVTTKASPRRKADGPLGGALASLTCALDCGMCLAHSWHVSLLSNGVEMQGALSNAPLQSLVSFLQEAYVGHTVDDLPCTHALIFGNPDHAPPELRKRFNRNRPDWVSGFNLRIDPLPRP